MSLLPKEHGAYGQMAFPLVASLIVAEATAPAVLIAVGVVAAFLAHEPLLVLLGRRGLRVKREESRRAAVWLGLTGLVAAVTGLAAVSAMRPGIRWWLLLPLLPAAFLAGAIATKREKSVLGEIAVALALSLVAAPICVSAGASAGTALAVAVAFVAVFVAATLAVRVIILTARGGGDPRTVRSTRVSVLLLAAAAVVGLLLAAWGALLPWAAPLAAAPGLIAAGWLAIFPPPPVRLRAVGWTLVATSATTALILVAGLHD